MAHTPIPMQSWRHQRPSAGRIHKDMGCASLIQKGCAALYLDIQDRHQWGTESPAPPEGQGHDFTRFCIWNSCTQNRWRPLFQRRQTAAWTPQGYGQTSGKATHRIRTQVLWRDEVRRHLTDNRNIRRSTEGILPPCLQQDKGKFTKSVINLLIIILLIIAITHRQSPLSYIYIIAKQIKM